MSFYCCSKVLLIILSTLTQMEMGRSCRSKKTSRRRHRGHKRTLFLQLRIFICNFNKGGGSRRAFSRS